MGRSVYEMELTTIFDFNFWPQLPFFSQFSILTENYLDMFSKLENYDSCFLHLHLGLQDVEVGSGEECF